MLNRASLPGVVMKVLVAMLAAILLTGCATQEGGRFTGKTTSTPFHDFNLATIAIPPVLLDARKQPYAMPLELTCTSLQSDIKRLDDVLGPDLDEEAPGRDAGDMVSEAASNALQGMIDGLVPFRSWIRRFSGADQHTRDINAAITAGTARRAFLKGVSKIQICQPHLEALADSAPL